MARASLNVVAMSVPGLHDVRIRWNPFRGYWIDNGFGVNPWHEFHSTESQAIRAAEPLVAQGTGRVLVQRGAEWHVVSAPALLDHAAALRYVRISPRS